MRKIWIITRKEIRSQFVTPVAYVVIAGFMLLAGFFFFGLVQFYNSSLYQAAIPGAPTPNLNEWVAVPFYRTLQVILVFVVPIITMRAFAEEKNHGTFELLITSPVSIGEIVIGKFLGIATVLILMLSLALVYPLVLILFTDPEVLPIFVGFLGILCFGLVLAGLGIACSAASQSQTVSALIGVVVSLLYYVIDSPVGKIDERIGRVLTYLAPSTHLELFIRGVITSTDVIYFVSAIALGVFLTARIVEGERVK